MWPHWPKIFFVHFGFTTTPSLTLGLIPLVASPSFFLFFSSSSYSSRFFLSFPRIPCLLSSSFSGFSFRATIFTSLVQVLKQLRSLQTGFFHILKITSTVATTATNGPCKPPPPSQPPVSTSPSLLSH